MCEYQIGVKQAFSIVKPPSEIHNPKMLIVSFPTRFEAKDLWRRLENPEPFELGEVRGKKGLIGGKEIISPILGMGPAAAARRTRALLEKLSPELFILAGFAGALTFDLKHGEVLAASNHAAEKPAEMKSAPLYSAREVISTANAKAKMAEETNCALVDMEAAFVAEIARKRGVKFLCVRAVSDLAGENLPAKTLSKSYDMARSKETPLKLLFHLLVRPHKISDFLKFIKPLAGARLRLADALVNFIDGRKTQ